MVDGQGRISDGSGDGDGDGDGNASWWCDCGLTDETDDVESVSSNHIEWFRWG